MAAGEAHAEVADARAVAGECVDDDVSHALRLLGGHGGVAGVARHAGGVHLLADAAGDDGAARAAAAGGSTAPAAAASARSRRSTAAARTAAPHRSTAAAPAR